MRNIGPILVILFSVLILGAMFLPYDNFDGNQDLWVLASGSDIALAIACVLALLVSIAALASKVGALRALAALFGGLVCGLIWAYTADSLKHTEGLKSGFWALTVLGALILFAAVIAALSSGSGREPAVAGVPAPAPIAPIAPSAPVAAQHPAGWFPDPAGGPSERYWDGTRWADQFRTPGS